MLFLIVCRFLVPMMGRRQQRHVNVRKRLRFVEALLNGLLVHRLSLRLHLLFAQPLYRPEWHVVERMVARLHAIRGR